MSVRQATGIAGLIDYFMHPALMLESDRRHRARILIATLIIFAVIIAITAVAVALGSFPLASKLAAAVICFFICGGCCLGLFALRRSGRFVLCSMVTVAVDVLSITGGILVSGGAVLSPATQLLAFPPLLGFFFGGIRWGSATALVALLEIIGFAVLAKSGVQFYSANDRANAGNAQLVIGVVGLVAVSAMAFIYEYTAAMLKRERDHEQERVNALARIDSLTGVSNRHGFDAELARRIDAGSGPAGSGTSPPRCFTLCCLDLNGFKPINDQYGHDVGDEVLREVSSRLQKSLRSTDSVGRHGGDEFLLLLNSQCERNQLQIVAARLLEHIAEPISTSVGMLSISGSFGFAVFPDHATSADALKHAADSAMYAAKRDGSGWCVYEAVEGSGTLTGKINEPKHPG